jgi:hypothetical protein
MKVSWEENRNAVKVYFYTEKGKGYHCFLLRKENAIKFFGQVKKMCEGDKDCYEVPLETFFGNEDCVNKTKFYKEDMIKLRPVLAEELNYITGKKERPPKQNFNLDEYFSKTDIKDKVKQEKLTDKEKEKLIRQRKKDS